MCDHQSWYDSMCGEIHETHPSPSTRSERPNSASPPPPDPSGRGMICIGRDHEDPDYTDYAVFQVGRHQIDRRIRVPASTLRQVEFFARLLDTNPQPRSPSPLSVPRSPTVSPPRSPLTPLSSPQSPSDGSEVGCDGEPRHMHQRDPDNGQINLTAPQGRSTYLSSLDKEKRWRYRILVTLSGLKSDQVLLTLVDEFPPLVKDNQTPHYRLYGSMLTLLQLLHGDKAACSPDLDIPYTTFLASFWGLLQHPRLRESLALMLLDTPKSTSTNRIIFHPLYFLEASFNLRVCSVFMEAFAHVVGRGLFMPTWYKEGLISRYLRQLVELHTRKLRRQVHQGLLMLLVGPHLSGGVEGLCVAKHIRDCMMRCDRPGTEAKFFSAVATLPKITDVEAVMQTLLGHGETLAANEIQKQLLSVHLLHAEVIKKTIAPFLTHGYLGRHYRRVGSRIDSRLPREWVPQDPRYLLCATPDPALARSALKEIKTGEIREEEREDMESGAEWIAEMAEAGW